MTPLQHCLEKRKQKTHIHTHTHKNTHPERENNAEYRRNIAEQKGDKITTATETGKTTLQMAV